MKNASRLKAWRRLATLALLSVMAGQVIGADAPRVTVFISDLHIGSGHVEKDQAGTYGDGRWHPYEDFRWTSEFEVFLKELMGRNRIEGKSIDLVVLGDLFELWQSPDDSDCPTSPGNLNLGCTEVGALGRLERILMAHKQDLTLLREFANGLENRVLIVPGNHDAALVFPSVGKRVVEAIGAGAGRVEVLGSGYWMSPDGKVFAEHGHQVKEDVNHFAKSPASCINERNEAVDCGQVGAFLLRPWGEDFVQGYFNKFERDYPIIDNISNESSAIRYALSDAKIVEVADAVGRGLKFLLLGQSVDQFWDVLGEKPEDYYPKWDIMRTRELLSARFLLESFAESRDYMVVEATRLAAVRELDVSVVDVADAEINWICDLRFLRWRTNPPRSRTQAELCPLENPAELTTLGAGIRKLRYPSAELDKQRVTAAAAGHKGQSAQPEGKFRYYIYGHTHQAHGPRAVATDDLNWTPRMMNSGAWQRVANLRQVQKMYLDLKNLRKDATKADVLRQEPDKLPPCYTYIYLGPYDKGDPEPMLLYYYFDQREPRRWRFGSMCPRTYEADVPEPS